MADHPAQAALTQGLRALAAGQVQAAAGLLAQAQRLAPMAPEPMAALGQLAASQQQWREAEGWFARALQARPAQPRVWFARAQVLEALERPLDAAGAFAEAARHQADWPAPHYQQARLLRELGQAAAALQQAQQATRLAPQDVNSLQLLAMLQEEAGLLDSARTTLTAALALAPERAALHHNLGVVLHRSGRHGEALTAHQQARGLGLDVAEAHYNLGNTLQALGQLAPALAAYREALARDPQHALSLYDLAKLRWALGHDGFDAELREAEARAPASDTAPGLLGLLLLKAGRAADAAAAYRRALALAPHRAAYADGLGQALSALGDHTGAAAAHQQALASSPQDAAVLCNTARSLYAAGETPAALACAERAHALAPLDQHALALLSVGWRLGGDARAAQLDDLDRCLGVLTLAPPPGFADIAAFNAALADELAALHTAREAPVDQTLRQGTQTRGNLFDLDRPLLRLLRAQIAGAVDGWLASRPDDTAHPFLGRRSEGWRFSDSWSSRLRRSGFHTNHVHGHGWLSCCYYVSAPQSALTGDNEAGWIQFGEPDLPEPLRAALPPYRLEAPVPGRLLLFPSYLWHGTRPFDEDAWRLTVAFDVLPQP